MISKDKQYRTRDGREVRIYATDGMGADAIHGAVFQHGKWVVFTWNAQGHWVNDMSQNDLIEVKPRIKRTVWLNVYHAPVGYHAGCYGSKDEADMYVSRSHQRIACVKVEIDCAEGEGL